MPAKPVTIAPAGVRARSPSTTRTVWVRSSGNTPAKRPGRISAPATRARGTAGSWTVAAKPAVAVRADSAAAAIRSNRCIKWFRRMMKGESNGSINVQGMKRQRKYVNFDKILPHFRHNLGASRQTAFRGTSLCSSTPFVPHAQQTGKIGGHFLSEWLQSHRPTGHVAPGAGVSWFDRETNRFHFAEPVPVTPSRQVPALATMVRRRAFFRERRDKAGPHPARRLPTGYSAPAARQYRDRTDRRLR